MILSFSVSWFKNPISFLMTTWAMFEPQAHPLAGHRGNGEHTWLNILPSLMQRKPRCIYTEGKEKHCEEEVKVKNMHYVI